MKRHFTTFLLALTFAFSIYAYSLLSVKRIFIEPEHLSDVWGVTLPSNQGELDERSKYRGINISDGALTILPRVPNSDTLHTLSDDIAFIEIELAKDSSTLAVMMGASKNQIAHIGQNTLFASTIMEPFDISQPVQMSLSDGDLLLHLKNKDVSLGPQSPGRLEFAPVEGAPRVKSITLKNSEGNLIFEENYAHLNQDIPYSFIVYAFMVSLLFAYSMVLIQDKARAFRLLLWLCVPLLISIYPQDNWLILTEKLYLAHTEPYDLSAFLLYASTVPFLVASLSCWPIFKIKKTQWRERKSDTQPFLFIYLAFSLICIVQFIYHIAFSLSPFDKSTSILFWTIFTICYVGSNIYCFNPFKLAFRSRKWIAMEAFALLPIAIFGFGWPVMMSLLFRWLFLNANLSELRIKHTNSTALYALSLVVLTYPSAEISVRNFDLNENWNADNLGLKVAKDKGWANANTAWEGQCGPDDFNLEKRIVFAGGSSTGSLSQSPELRIEYFPELIHNKICESVSNETKLVSYNYGGGDRNTFTIAKTLDTLLSPQPPDVFVVYAGVNDILTKRHPLTRRQRHESMNKDLQVQLYSLGRHSRIISGLSLLFKQGKGVSEVPVKDAAEFTESIIDRMGHGHVFLMTELVQSQSRAELEPYREMQKALSTTHGNVHYIDLMNRLEEYEIESMLTDLNHLSQQGHQQLSSIILEDIQSKVIED